MFCSLFGCAIDLSGSLRSWIGLYRIAGKMRIHKFSIIFDNVLGVRLKFHWSIFPAMIMFGGLKFQPALYVSFIALILIHEIGHALIVKAYAFENHELIVHGLGGACIWSGSATQKQICIISWGGVIAQLSLFIIFLLLPKLIALPPDDYLDQIFRTFLETNLFIMIFNLIPCDPMDGAESWKIFGPMWNDFKSLKNRQKFKRSDKIVQNQIIKILKENSGEPRQRRQRRPFPRR